MGTFLLAALVAAGAPIEVRIETRDYTMSMPARVPVAAAHGESL